MASLPSTRGGPTTSEAGFLALDAERLSAWLVEALGDVAAAEPAGWSSLDDAVRDLGADRSPGITKRALVPLGAWSVLLTGGPLGTDVGMIPSLVARAFGVRGIRAVCVPDGEDPYPARLLEVYGPGGAPPLLTERGIAVAVDGGRWVFETSGTPYPFEDLARYEAPRKRDRLPPDLLHEYLDRLGVPDGEPGWAGAIMVTHRIPWLTQD